MKKIVASILALLIVIGCTWAGIQWNKTVRIWETDADRQVFKATTAYSEAAATLLADSYKQYKEAEDEAEKHAIMEYVIMRYPNLDTDTIDNDTLRQFYIECLNY